MLLCEIQKGRQHMGSWGTVELWFGIWLQRFNMLFFLVLLDSEWLSAHPSINCSRGSKNPPAELLLHFPPPHTIGWWECRKCGVIWASNDANTKKWALEGSAVAEGMTKPGTVTAEMGSGQKNVSGMHMWILVPGSLVGNLTSILLQQRFPISWNKIKRAFMGELPFKSTHFPVKMKVSHKLHLWFPQDFSLALFWQFKTPLIFEQGLSLCTSDLDYGLWQW